MTASRVDNETIFHSARDIPDPERRQAYLRETCGGNESLLAEIEALLAIADAPDSLLDHPPLGVSAVDETRTGPSGAEADDGLDFLDTSDRPDSIGRLGHFEVQEVIGRGGMGVVLRAFDERLHRMVAIKVMAPQLATSATARQRFTREARAAAAVTHDHIVTIHAVEDAGPLPYIVMQFVAGSSLQDRLDRSGPLSVSEILRIGMQTASGLAAAHAQGLIHRDVKPANILLENGVERVKLTDFGLARAVEDASVTQSGVVAGTPSFMSPEQAEGRSLDPRSDLFSLGSVLYALSTGRPPFRSGTSMGVLKRVCEETPTPVRESNPEIPGWLATVIEKLHAKDPAARYQSAAEVAELLGRHLAHVQHPSVVPLPAVAKSSAPAPARHRRRRRWAVAAAALVAMFAALGTTEATGVTNVRATVTRVLTPGGTLVVETDDPNVKIIVEGDGDLVITGAGPQEVRLRAGSYRLHAVKDGKPIKLDHELVTITRGDRAIVRVRMEGDVSTAAAETVVPGAFVLIAAGTERKFDSLAETVLVSTDGDTIEVRGNGPFVTDPIEFKHALTIRAGAGFRPVLVAAPRSAYPSNSFLLSFGALRLEGLEVRGSATPYRILEAKGPLWAANCRFTTGDNLSHCCIEGESEFIVRNCELESRRGAALALHCDSEATSVATNNLLVGHVNLGEFDLSRSATFRFIGNTHVSPFNNAYLHLTFQQPARTTDPLKKPVHVFAAGNVISAAGPFGFLQNQSARPHLSAKDAEIWVRRRVDWREENNCYQGGAGRWIQIGSDGTTHTTVHRTLADWSMFWGLRSTGSSEGVIRFQGGDLITKAATHGTKLTPEDFRLRSDSAAYRAGKDGKDLGADVDLVGPGPAYERWKKTPEYQQWLKDSGHLKK